ncbi:hypothetical protein [Variovorax sp. dw_308]|uniref:hypothetical protein n=1 Tax=Variovorax sp. dw_308 TaxID=2721546 RepID=UPI001C491B07|nr:hypothetical protein [Variovorax sp. dw_308]
MFEPTLYAEVLSQPLQPKRQYAVTPVPATPHRHGISILERVVNIESAPTAGGLREGGGGIGAAGSVHCRARPAGHSAR